MAAEMDAPVLDSPLPLPQEDQKSTAAYNKTLLVDILMSSGSTPVSAVLVYICVIGIFFNLLAANLGCCLWRKLFNVYPYVINLCIADSVLLFCGMVANNDGLKQVLWQNPTACIFINGLDFVSVHVATYTMVLMSWERYHFLQQPSMQVKPLRVYVGKCGCAWLGSCVTVAPLLLPTVEGLCAGHFSRAVSVAYSTFIFLTSYLIPGIAVTYLYYRVFMQARGALAHTSNPRYHSYQMFITKTICLIIATFWLCYLPQWILTFLAIFGWATVGESGRMAAMALTYLNSVSNPFIYVLLGRESLCFDAILDGTVGDTQQIPLNLV